VEPHDEQQARVVERLRAADGAPVSFAELRAMGVENPALLCYELAAVGLPVERPREPGSGVLALSVRLEPSSAAEDGHGGTPREHGQQLQGGEHSPGGERQSRRPPIGRGVGLSTGRPLTVAGMALVLVAAVGVAFALGRSSGQGDTGLSADAAHPGAGAHTPRAGAGAKHAGRRTAPTAPHPHAAPTPIITPTPNGQPGRASVSPAAAAALEATGHQLLGAGRYAAAIAELRSAVQASGGSPSRCAEPTSEACLTYAYALYDLGRALQLDGDPAAAIPILSERLRIDNQRETVQQELDLARSANA
jgi:hypothetical protein